MNGPEALANTFEGEEMRTRAEALTYVTEDIKKLLSPEVIREGVETNCQVEVGGTLRDVDLQKMPECGCIIGAQQVIGNIKEKLEVAREAGNMPHEELFYGLFITYLEGVEAETKSTADVLALRGKVPEVDEFVDLMEETRETVINLRAANDESSEIEQDDAA